MASSDSDRKPLVALIGTLDTKRAEYQYAASYLESHGCNVLVLDASTQQSQSGPSSFDLGPDSTLLSPLGLLHGSQIPSDRSAARDALRSACLEHLSQLHSEGKLDGIASFGGSQNTSFATSIMRDSAFPIGLPKLMLSTMASGDVNEYLGESDICIMPSVGDISGSLNAITLTTLRNALAAVNGMAQGYFRSKHEQKNNREKEKPMIAISMFGVTTIAVNQISDLLKEKGYEPVAFHATGSGGRSMERLIREGFFSGVIDLTTTEICDHLYGGVLSAGPDRLTAAAEKGVPQVVSVGALDMVNFGSLSSLPSKYQLKDKDEGPLHETKDGAKVYEHNSQVTLIRTSVEQNKELGGYLVKNLRRGLEKAKETKGVKIVFPNSGISAMDGVEGVWDDAEARRALLDGVKEGLGEKVGIELHVEELHINSTKFAEVIVEQMTQLLAKR